MSSRIAPFAYVFCLFAQYNFSFLPTFFTHGFCHDAPEFLIHDELTVN
jgi:hypothetical protein